MKQENCCTPEGQIKRYKDCIGCDKKPKQEMAGKAFYESADKVIVVKRQETIEEAVKNNIIEDWLKEHGDPEIDKKIEKQLELEEAASKLFGSLKTGIGAERRAIWMNGAKWQAERMYSEEEVLNLWDWLNNGFMLRRSLPSREELISWFEQFKKK